MFVSGFAPSSTASESIAPAEYRGPLLDRANGRRAELVR